MTETGWWRLRTLCDETIANLLARRGRYMSLATVVIAIIGGLVLSDLSAARTLIESRTALAVAGSEVVVIRRDKGGLDAAICSSLTDQPHVIASGGLRRAEVVRFKHAERTPFQAFFVTDGLLDVLSPDVRRSEVGLVLAQAAATELGATRGSWVTLANRQVVVAEVLDTEPRAQALSRAVLLPMTPVGVVDECWVEFTDGTFTQAVGVLPAMFATDGLMITPLVGRNLGSRDLKEEWTDRPLKFGWAAGAILILAYVLLLSFRRRAELALYILLGARRTVVALMQIAELWIVLLIGGSVGTAWGVFLASLSGHVARQALTHGVRQGALVTLLILALAPISALLIIRSDLMTLLKERPG